MFHVQAMALIMRLQNKGRLDSHLIADAISQSCMYLMATKLERKIADVRLSKTRSTLRQCVSLMVADTFAIN